MKRKILQQFFKKQINNGGPARGAMLLMNSSLKEKYEFVEMGEFFSFKKNYFKQFLYFYKTIKRVRPDIVHIRGVQSEGFWGVLAANILKVKCVLSVHGLASDSKIIGDVKKKIYKFFLEAYALRNADLVYCVCKYAAERDYIRKNAKHLYGYIHNAAPNYDLTNRVFDRRAKRSELGISENKIVLTNIGRVTKDKGLEILLQSYLELITKYDNIILCIAGDGYYLSEIRNEYKQMIDEGKILILGKISDVKETLLASDIFVFPTLHENLSNALLEACYVGLPIVATNVGGNPEVVEHEKTGLLVEPNNVSALSKAIELLINDERLRTDLAKAASLKIKEEYSQDYIFKQISKMYDSIL